MKNGYHILLLEIINNRLIKAFKARLNGQHLEIAGREDTGKTTGSSALWEIITPGTDRITHGKKKSTVKAVLGNGKDTITAIRSYVPSGSSISVTKHIINEDGIPEVQPITANDFKAMLSPLSSNPQDIKSMKSKDKVKLLLSSAGIPEESYEAADATIAKAAVELGEAQARRKDHVPGDEPEKADPVGSEALSKKIADIGAHNAKCDELDRAAEAKLAALNAGKSDLSEADGDNAILEETIKDLEKKLNERKAELKEGRAKRAALAKIVTALKKESEAANEAAGKAERIPSEEISKEVEKAEKLNRLAAAHKEWEDRVAKDKAAGERLSKAQKAHKAALKAKKDIMDGAEFPLPGLTIEDGDLWYNGMLVDNLGESKEMLVYGSLAIEDALSHDIRAVRMDGIESMGESDYRALRDLATEKGVQLFTTRVTRGEEIEDPEIVIIDGYYPEPEEPAESE